MVLKAFLQDINHKYSFGFSRTFSDLLYTFEEIITIKMEKCDNMNKTCKMIAIMAGLMTLVTAVLTPTASADGWHPSEEFLHLYEPFQKAVIYWTGHVEIMYLSSAVKVENLTNIAWVVPIISTCKPNVTAGNMSIFEELVEFFGPSNWWEYYRGKNDAYHTMGHDNVTIIEVKEVDIYDVIIVKATNASDLLDWLIVNNLKVPENAFEIINNYVQKDNCYFVINKLDLKNRFSDVLEQIENGAITNESRFNEYQKVIDDLSKGMATPLRFEFMPPNPYYPLSISSLNKGDGKIEVYVIAEKPVIDKNNILTFDKCKKVTDELKEKLEKFFFKNDGELYVTRLSYFAELEKLSDDAEFEFLEEVSKYHPVFFGFPSKLEGLSGLSQIDILTYDPNGGILELHYRLDGKGPWILANGANWFKINVKKIILESLYVYSYGPYGQYVGKNTNALWSIGIDTEDLTDGNHTIELRVFRQRGDSFWYTPALIQEFTVDNTKEIKENVIDQSKIDFGPIVLSGLIVISMIAIAIISKKTKLTL